MAFSFVDLLSEFLPAKSVHYSGKLLVGHGITQIIHVAMLDEDDLVCLTESTGDTPSLLVPFWHKCRTYIEGYASFTARSAAVCAVSTFSVTNTKVSCLVPVCPVGPLQSISSSASSATRCVLATLTSATKRSSFACAKPSQKHVKFYDETDSLESRGAALMDKAKCAINEVFIHSANSSPWFLDLALGTPIMWHLQKDLYRLRSRSHLVVARGAFGFKNLFLDMLLFRWDWMSVTPFQIAAWVRGKVLGGAASAAVQVKITFILIAKATDVSVHAEHPLVVG